MGGPRKLLSDTRAALLLVATAVLLASPAGCSFVVESRDTQCTRDEDCSGHENAVCDVAGGICVPASPTGGSTSSTGCEGPDGCYACPPAQQAEFLNACTDVECVPYDNTPLEALLQSDGTVPPVP